MLIELYIFAFVIIAYGTFTTLAIIGFNKLNRSFHRSKKFDSLFISIVVSARNEEKNIKEFLHEIIKQDFPKTRFELIFVDDNSTDHTYLKAKEVLEQSGLNYQLIKQENHQGKKKNLAHAIDIAKGQIIITTDADVVHRHFNWLSTISDYFNACSPNMLIMAVDFNSQNDLLSTFQIIENVALTAITAGYSGVQKPFMCNGANLAFTKHAFEAVNGYQTHIAVSSGEDVFLMEAIKKQDPSSVHYILQRELIVKTTPASSLTMLINQRVRWASKIKINSNPLNTFAGFIILMANLIFLALLVAILKKSFIIPYLSIFALAKFVFDFLLLFLASDYLGRIKYIWWLIPFECLYWIYTLLIGITSLFYKPYWKGKKIN
ncbi:MAG: glycosyltransferase [Bacteroidia bacterium]|nr:glycosyltransferase [Bacteroidia bacterium]